MSISLDFRFRMLQFTYPSLVALCMTNGVGGCWWPISSREILRAVPIWKLTNNSPSSDSIELSRKLFIVVHSTWMSTLSGGGLWGGSFGFVDGLLK